MEENRHEPRTAPCEFESELQAYMEGEDGGRVGTHAKACASCSAILADLESLRHAAHELPLEGPSPALWANVRARLAEEGVFAEAPGFRGWFRRLEIVSHPVPSAVFAALLVFGCFLTGPRPTQLGPENTAEVAAAPVRTSVASMAIGADSEPIEQVVRDLEATFRTRQGSLAPDLKVVYESSLKSLDVSIRECRESLKGEPGNTLAHEFLLAAYTQKAQVLTSALEFDASR